MKLNKYEGVFIFTTFLFVVLFICSLFIPASGITFAENPDLSLGHFTLNINTASAEQFSGLDGISKNTAYRISEYRDELGGFKRREDLLAVDGITHQILYNLEDFLTIN